MTLSSRRGARGRGAQCRGGATCQFGAFSRASTNCSTADEVVTLDSGDRGPNERFEETPVRLYFEQFWHESEGTRRQGSSIGSLHAPLSVAVVVQGVVNLGD